MRKSKRRYLKRRFNIVKKLTNLSLLFYLPENRKISRNRNFFILIYSIPVIMLEWILFIIFLFLISPLVSDFLFETVSDLVNLFDQYLLYGFHNRFGLHIWAFQNHMREYPEGIPTWLFDWPNVNREVKKIVFNTQMFLLFMLSLPVIKFIITYLIKYVKALKQKCLF